MCHAPESEQAGRTKKKTQKRRYECVAVTPNCILIFGFVEKSIAADACVNRSVRHSRIREHIYTRHTCSTKGDREEERERERKRERKRKLVPLKRVFYSFLTSLIH